MNADTKQPEFVIAWAKETSIEKDVVITQKDVRQIQLAKGALYAGLQADDARMGIDKVDVVKIAGAFGTHVDRTKALIMGLFPDCDIEKILSRGQRRRRRRPGGPAEPGETGGGQLVFPQRGIHRTDRGKGLPGSSSWKPCRFRT